MRDINYPLVESKRPPIYTSMKYWGKKPHNIWNTYIKTYTKSGFFMDPFSGSGMSAFESALAKRKCIALDLNPLTSFVIEVVSSQYDDRIFCQKVNDIVTGVLKDPTYNKIYRYKSDEEIIHNTKWNNGKIYEICTENLITRERKCLTANGLDYEACDFLKYSDINLNYPNYKFRKAISFSSSFLEQIGNSYDKLFTPRNLYTLSLIFQLIIEEKDETIKKQLLYGFIQTVHLSSKMCVPRGKSCNRDFSTSWGRSAYLASKKQMEMNPLLLFKNNCIGKQSVQSVMLCAKERYKNGLIIKDINIHKFDPNEKVDIWYGIVDAKNLSNVIPEQTIEFILTDPPYGGLIQYLDLSSIWLAWLELYDSKYRPNYGLEITVGNDKSEDDFSFDFSKALIQFNKVLKNDGTIVITFNNKNLETWASFIKAINAANFSIEDIIHQPNKRSGESNVNDPNGVSSSDYYIRCKKTNYSQLEDVSEAEQVKMCEMFVSNILSKRKEPTPYQILFNEYIRQLAYSHIAFDPKICDLDNILNLLKNEIYSENNKENRSGNYYWFRNKKSSNKLNLKSKLNEFVKKYFDENENVQFDDLMQSIYKKFNGTLEVDIETIKDTINKYNKKILINQE